jgi:hypothetical protein
MTDSRFECLKLLRQSEQYLFFDRRASAKPETADKKDFDCRG